MENKGQEKVRHAYIYTRIRMYAPNLCMHTWASKFLVSYSNKAMFSAISYSVGLLWSLVVFDPNYDLTQNNIVTVFNERFSEV